MAQFVDDLHVQGMPIINVDLRPLERPMAGNRGAQALLGLMRDGIGEDAAAGESRVDRWRISQIKSGKSPNLLKLEVVGWPVSLGQPTINEIKSKVVELADEVAWGTRLMHLFRDNVRPDYFGIYVFPASRDRQGEMQAVVWARGFRFPQFHRLSRAMSEFSALHVFLLKEHQQ